MFKVLYNAARLALSIEPRTPLLIKSGSEGMDPTIPDMRFVRTHSTMGETVFIPGSSLKGVVRSYAEKVLRSVSAPVCDILSNACACTREYDSYRKKLENYEKGKKRSKTNLKFPEMPASPLIRNFVKGKKPKDLLQKKLDYAYHCYACRTFGSTDVGSHIRFSDAYPWRWEMNEEDRKKSLNRIKTGVRTGVAIDRQTGAGKAKALFDLEVVTAGAFYGQILMRNFQIWQLALITLVLQHIDQGYQQLGSCKTRGLGEVTLRIDRVEIDNYGQLAGLATGVNNLINGIGQLEEARKRYNLIDNDCVKAGGFQSQSIPLGKSYLLTNESDILGFISTLLNSQNWENLKKAGVKKNEEREN